MNMARYEQETIISFNEEEKTAGSGLAVDSTIPISWIRIAPNRVLSDAEKIQRRNAIKKANFALDNAGRPQD